MIYNLPCEWMRAVESLAIKPDIYVFIDQQNISLTLERNRRCEWKRRGPYDTLEEQLLIYQRYLGFFLESLVR